MLNENCREILLSIVSEVFGLPRTLVNDDLTMQNTKEWDSFNHLLLISEVEKRFNVKFTISEMQEIRTVSAIIEKIEHYAVS